MNAPVEVMPRSLRHDRRAFITFINRTGYPVDIGWLDYKGEVVRYRRSLANGALSHFNTFVSHPWKAWHANTLEPAVFGGSTIFMPQPWQGEQNRTVVYIDRPLKSLLDLTIQTVKNLVRAEDVDKLEIPRDLLESLRRRRCIEFVDFNVYRR